MSEKTEKDNKVFQSYLDNIKAKTGKTPADFHALAEKQGLTTPWRWCTPSRTQTRQK